MKTTHQRFSHLSSILLIATIMGAVAPSAYAEKCYIGVNSSWYYYNLPISGNVDLTGPFTNNQCRSCVPRGVYSPPFSTPTITCNSYPTIYRVRPLNPTPRPGQALAAQRDGRGG